MYVRYCVSVTLLGCVNGIELLQETGPVLRSYMLKSLGVSVMMSAVYLQIVQ